MNYLNLKYNLIFFFISFIYVSTKYFFSIIEFPNENFILKIMRFSDLEYAYLVESLSRFDFSTDWSYFEKSKNIIGFPIFSIIFHAITFKAFGYYSFYILEIIFFFLIICIFFKILIKLEKDVLKSLNGILILLVICQFIEFGKFYDPGLFAKFNPVTEFIGLRFPRPLVTSVFALIFLINLMNITDKKFIECKNNIYFISLSLALLINSFFHLFFIFFVLAILYLIPKILNEGLVDLNNKTKIIFNSSLIILVGISVFFIQQSLSEIDYSNRIGVHYLNLSDKLKNSIDFLKIYTKAEYILLFLICLSLKLYFNLKKKKEIYNKYLSIFWLFIISSFISPLIFIFLSNKVIVSHHFLTIIKFSLFLFVFISFFLLIKKIFIKKFFFIPVILLIFLLINNFSLKKLDENRIQEEVSIYNFFKKNNYVNSDKILFANKSFFFDNVWFSLGNKYISVTNSFVSSQKDKQIENSIYQIFKIFNVNKNNFNQIVDDKSCIRECFAEYFQYKYVVNSIRHFKPLASEYSKEISNKIKNISSIDWWYTFLPNSEKMRLKNEYFNYEYDPNHNPHIIILKNNSKLFFERDLSKDYKKVINGKFYKVFEKIN